MKIRLHRNFDFSTAGRINIKLRNNDWYANITCETPVAVSSVLPSKSIGIDVGLNYFVATSKGDLIDNPRHLKKKEKYLKRVQRRLSRKKKDSPKCGLVENRDVVSAKVIELRGLQLLAMA